MNRNVRRTWCNIFAGLFSIIFIVPIACMLFDRELPVILYGGRITPDTVVSGQPVTVTWQATINRICEGTFIRRIVDSGGFVIESKFGKIESFELLGKRSGEFSKTITLPQMLPGPATYQVIMTYWCNPGQEYIWPIQHAEEIVRFTVVNSFAPPAVGSAEQIRSLHSR